MKTPATNTNPETYYKMPPVGMTETKARVGMTSLSQFTVRCGSANCWFVGHGGNQVDAQHLLDEHACPTPPRRNELPTGRSTLEKLWDEMDDVTEALIEKKTYNGMQGESLKAYALGIAFTLSMMTHPYFRTIREISREAGARYKMSKGLAEWRPTPSYNYNPMPAQLTANVVANDPNAVKRAPKQRAKPAPAAPKAVNLSGDTVQAIKSAFGSGMFSKEELAGMYKTSVAQVNQIVG